ncbi:MAG: DUF1624 domain-containing protein [Methanolinea sp.]|nr:DUF1624 domain-containing protein [Methanolinea sp.]
MENVKGQPARFWEVDFIRGIAVIMMICFHLVFDLAYLDIFDAGVYSGPWRFVAICTVSLFLFIAGISLSISSARAKGTLHGSAYVLKFVKRGAGIFALGLLITLATFLLVPDAPVIFGILHLIGISIIIAPLFLPYRWANLVGGFLLVTAGAVMPVTGGTMYLLWLGFPPDGFSSIDYTPVIPWLGVLLIGVFAGKTLYPGGRRRFEIPDVSLPLRGGISLLGRHSLAIYLVHQPVILLLIFIIWSVPFPGAPS